MVIIPKASKDAEPVLSQLRTQRAHCTFFVLQPGDGGAQLASDADIRAENHPFRRVVWVPNPDVVRENPANAPLANALNDGALVCVMTFDFRVSSTLKSSDTIDLLAIERAFQDAEGDA